MTFLFSIFCLYSKLTKCFVFEFQGSEQSRIVLTSAEPPEQLAKEVPDLRLVDGPSILAGRVQLLHKGEWRSVCTNSRK